ncbi:MAG TPA: hypothetical protein VMT05_06295 [Terriglobales bacterium]|jgi:hypothetical protein|nr:hypothetical protein [Terriglobales bacterium]
MKVGAEDRTKVILLAVLGLAAVISVGYMFSSLDRRPAPVAAAPPSPRSTALPAPVSRRPARGPAIAAVSNSLDPELRLKLLESSEGTKYEGTGRNIFVPALEAIPNPIAPGMPGKKEPPPPPPGPPPPPPINLKFFGFASHAGEPKRIFLAQGEDVFIGAEGDIVDRRYRIVRINPTSVEIEDVLNNNRQTIPLTQS